MADANVEAGTAPRRPVAKFGAGPISIAIWQHRRQVDGRSWDAYSCKIENQYRDKDGNWQSSDSYSPSNLEDLLLVVQRALQFTRVRDLLSTAPEDARTVEPF